MITTGCDVETLAGCHDDGWCAPVVRGLLQIREPGDTITFTVWVKAEPSSVIPSFFVKLDGRASGSFRVPYGEPYKLYANQRLAPGDRASFEIVCDNRATNLGDDQRRLSFVLQEIAIA